MFTLLLVVVCADPEVLQHQERLTAAAVSTKGTLATASESGNIVLWNLKTKKEISSFAAGEGVADVVFVGELIVTTSEQETRVWKDGKAVNVLEPGKKLAAGNGWLAIKPNGEPNVVLDTKTWDVLADFTRRRQSRYADPVALIAYGDTLLLACAKGGLNAYDVRAKRLIPINRDNEDLVAFAGNGKAFAASTETGTYGWTEWSGEQKKFTPIKAHYLVFGPRGELYVCGDSVETFTNFRFTAPVYQNTDPVVDIEFYSGKPLIVTGDKVVLP